MTTVRVRIGDRWYTVEVGDLSRSPATVTVDGEAFQIDIEVDSAPGPVPARPVPPRPPAIRAVPDAPPAPAAAPAGSPVAAAPADDILRSPMPGRVMSVLVRPGDAVAAGAEVCVVEAMKMEQSILAHRDGIVKTVFVQPLDSVNANDPLVELE